MVSFWDPWCFEPYQAYIPNRSKEIPIPTPPCDKTPTQRNIQNLHVNDRKNHYANDAVETTQVKLRILVEIQCYHWDSDLLSLQSSTCEAKGILWNDVSGHWPLFWYPNSTLRIWKYWSDIDISWYFTYFTNGDQQKNESAFVFGFPGSTIQMSWVWNVLTCTEDKKGKSPLESKKQKHHECFAMFCLSLARYDVCHFRISWVLDTSM